MAGEQRLVDADCAPMKWSNEREFVEVGGLTAYGINNIAMFLRLHRSNPQGRKVRRDTDYQPTKFEPVINLKTTKTLGLEIPPKVLTLVDEVIE
jgi:putative ABC transport system substrate-binding protein